MKAAGTSVFILQNGNLAIKHQADSDSWDIVGKLVFEVQAQELWALFITNLRYFRISGSNILHSL